MRTVTVYLKSDRTFKFEGAASSFNIESNATGLTAGRAVVFRTDCVTTIIPASSIDLITVEDE